MTITYSRHAEERMLLRGITKEQVEQALANHHTELPGTGGTTKFFADVDGKVLGVYALTTPNHTKVTTVFWK